MQLIDTHCHIDSSVFDVDRAKVLSAANKIGIKKIVVPATTAASWPKLLSICNSTDSLYPALGLHPVYLAQHCDKDIAALEHELSESDAVAVGEIGLDYFIKDLDRYEQKKILDAQLAVARAAGLPVILHCRKAYDDLIKMLADHGLNGGIAHAFNGSIQHAHKLIDLGFKLGFGGMLTYPHSSKLKKLVKALPISSIVLETDSPDLTVSQHRGERNSPAYLPYVLEALAQVRGQPIEELAAITCKSSREVFGI